MSVQAAVPPGFLDFVLVAGILLLVLQAALAWLIIRDLRRWP